MRHPKSDDTLTTKKALVVKAAKKTLKKYSERQLQWEDFVQILRTKKKFPSSWTDKQLQETLEAACDTRFEFLFDNHSIIKCIKKDYKEKEKKHMQQMDEQDSSSLIDDDIISWRRKNKVVVDVDSSSDLFEVETVSKIAPCQTFDELRRLEGITSAMSRNPGLLTVIEKLERDFERPSPVQAQAWPLLLKGLNTVGIAETGSGKTLGFCLPALAKLGLTTSKSNQLQSQRQVRMLVLSPTRELALQSQVVLQEYGNVIGFMTLVVYGGVSKQKQTVIIQKRCTDAIVATPGRLKDLLNGRNNALNLAHVEYLVLDEADRMLDLGFLPDVQFIAGQCTRPNRQTVMFSATWPASIQHMAINLFGSTPPVRLYVGFETTLKETQANENNTTSSESDQFSSGKLATTRNSIVLVDNTPSANKRVKQTIEVLEDHQREFRLRQLLQSIPKMPDRKGETCRVLVFCLYKKEAERLEGRLKQAGYKCTSIHGNKAQPARTEALNQFKSGEVPLLIATDVASRGLHIPNVYLVINYTFPLTIEDYVHRIGRTGRAGLSGISITFFQPSDKARAGELQQVLRQAGQDIPESLLKFGSTVKRKEHKLYGNFGPASVAHGAMVKKATKTTFTYSDDEN